MKVKMTRVQATPTFVRKLDQVYEVSDEEGKALINENAAVEVPETKRAQVEQVQVADAPVGRRKAQAPVAADLANARNDGQPVVDAPPVQVVKEGNKSDVKAPEGNKSSE